MADQPALVSAAELAQRNGVTFPNESAQYRRARTARCSRAWNLIESVAYAQDVSRAVSYTTRITSHL